jgi:hypothetical protein|nr:MAG TPA: hypothetical protein [Crassvirales sp.]
MSENVPLGADQDSRAPWYPDNNYYPPETVMVRGTVTCSIDTAIDTIYPVENDELFDDFQEQVLSLKDIALILLNDVDYNPKRKEEFRKIINSWKCESIEVEKL